jgi:hypothetical protein
MRNHAYMAIVEGARGLWWWSLGDNALKAVCSGWCAEKTTHMNNLKTLVNEIAALEPALLADDAHGALTGNSNTNIKTKVKVVGGKGYVFAYNATNSSQTTTFTWRSATGSVAVHSENNRSLGGGAGFSDSFAPFAARVYVIANGGTGGGGTPPQPTPTPTPTPTPSLTASFSSPAAGATVGGSSNVGMSVTGSPSTAQRTFELLVDSARVSLQTGVVGNTAAFTWNTASVSNGAHSLRLVVTDTAGGSATATRSVTVSNAAPSTGGLKVAITQPTNAATVRGTAWAVMWVEGQAPGNNTFELFANGRLVASRVSNLRGPISLPWITTGGPNGAVTLEGRVRDAASKTGVTRVNVTVAN